MNSKLAWTTQLGEAVTRDQEAVLEAIQRVRAFAYEGGELRSSDKQVVIVEQEVIKIEPPTPQVIYVPQYYSYPSSSTVIYQDNDDEVFAGFAVGLIIGAAIADDHYFDWHHGYFHYSDDVYDDIRRIQDDRQQFVRERHQEAQRNISQRQADRRAQGKQTLSDRTAGKRGALDPTLKDRQRSERLNQANRQEYQNYRSRQNQTNRNISRQRQQSLSSRSSSHRSSSLFGDSRRSSRSTQNYSQRGFSSRSRGGIPSGGRRR